MTTHEQYAEFEALRDKAAGLNAEEWEAEFRRRGRDVSEASDRMFEAQDALRLAQEQLTAATDARDRADRLFWAVCTPKVFAP